MRDPSPVVVESHSFDGPGFGAVRPHLLFFADRHSGLARRVEDYVEAALQRRCDHEVTTAPTQIVQSAVGPWLQ
jgi:hypothetical protein